MTAAKPNLLLAASAIVYFVASVALLFAPAEIGAFAGAPPDGGRERLLQVFGGALLGLAMLNWSSRHSRTAGIFGRPLVLANLAHAATAFLVLFRPAARDLGDLPLVAATVAYLALAVAFGSRLFVAPSGSD